MWKLGDTVMYGAAGICSISDIRDEKFGDEIKQYFILKPVFDDKNTFFVPTFNENLMAKIRPVMSKDEAISLIRSMPHVEPCWIDNDKVRQEGYREILESGDRMKVVSVLKALHDRREQLTKSGKKMRTSDEILMRSAEMLIENECAHILKMTRSELREFIDREIAEI